VLSSASAEGSRNLAAGVFLALAALPVAGIAFLWAPKEAFVAISTALLISLLVFIFFQLRLVAQRNGLFALLSAGFLVTLSVPVLVKVGASSSDWAEWLVQIKHSQGVVPAPAPGAPVQGGLVAGRASAPLTPEAAVSPANTASTPVAAQSDAPKTPAAPGANPAEPKSPVAPAPPSGARENAETAETSRPAAADPEETVSERTTRLAKDEALKRYPNLRKVGSREHSRYIQTFNEFERLHKHEFFADPAWPLNLAELLAERDGWKRADAPSAPQAPAPREEPSRRAEKPVPPVLSSSVAAAAAAAAEGAIVAGEAAAAPAERPPTSEDAPVGKMFGLDLPESDPSNPNSRLVADALQEVKRRYPPVAQVGSPENRLFVEAYQEYDRLRPDFFENPRWPIRLIDLVAKREGWKKPEPAP
jgi:hypothetical protein